jgi:endonuclease YncB( thermonuclease family)
MAASKSWPVALTYGANRPNRPSSRWVGLVVSYLLSAWPPSALAQPGPHTPFEITGTVISNHDGDTIDLLTADRSIIRVRLSGADTPETGQAFWKVARNHLRTLVAGKEAFAWCYKRDKYGREVCHVRIGTTDVCRDLIQNGLAWYAHMFSQELPQEQRTSYAEAEEEARARRIGLWSASNPMPPWECRRLRKAGHKCR